MKNINTYIGCLGLAVIPFPTRNRITKHPKLQPFTEVPMSTYIIYKTICLINQKIYIGQHNTSANDGYLGSGKLISYAIKKHGKENFIRETLEFCTSANVNERKIYWISELSTTNKKIGYNITKGGNGVGSGINHPNYGKNINTGKNNPMFGKNGSLNPNFGNKWNDEQKQKLSIIKSGCNNFWFGKKRNEHSNLMIGENNPNNQWYYKLSNGLNKLLGLF